MLNESVPAVSKLLDLSGQSVLITGASGNIGAGIARRIAEAGATVIAHYHQNENAARSLTAETGGTTVAADLTEAKQVDKLFDQVSADLVVNNAAIQPVRNLADMSLDAWRAVIQSNLDSAFAVTQRACQRWRAEKVSGAIVNIASIEGTDPALGHGHYATSKAGLLMMTRSFALEFGAAGIRVNAVSPGLIERDDIEADWPDGVARWRARAPLGRLGTPKDVADAVLFLLSPAARWISGANLIVDGGMSAQSRW